MSSLTQNCAEMIFRGPLKCLYFVSDTFVHPPSYGQICNPLVVKNEVKNQTAQFRSAQYAVKKNGLVFNSMYPLGIQKGNDFIKPDPTMIKLFQPFEMYVLFVKNLHTWLIFY